jgi:hypothetical protein
MLRPSPSDRTCWEGHHAQHWIAYSLVSYICSLFLAGVRVQSCIRLILTVRTVGIVPFPEVLSGPMAKFSLFVLRLMWSLFSSVLSFLMVRVSNSHNFRPFTRRRAPFLYFYQLDSSPSHPPNQGASELRSTTSSIECSLSSHQIQSSKYQR